MSVARAQWRIAAASSGACQGRSRPHGTQMTAAPSEMPAGALVRQADGPRGLFGGASGRRDQGTVFVAGGTGRLGARIVRQLLQQGLK